MIKILIFAGIDPGSTVGYCILDTQGNIIELGSKKEFSANFLVKFLSSIGTVLVVASDKKRTPYFVRTIATKLGAVCFSTKEDIAVKEKIRVTKHLQYKNSHERDAAASVLLAYENYKSKINEIGRFLQSANREEISEHFIEIGIKHPKYNYKQIIEMIDEESKLQIRKSPVEVIKQEPNRNIINNILRQNNQLTKENLRLRQENRILMNRINKLANWEKPKTDKDLVKIMVFKEKRFHSLQESYQELEKTNRNLKKELDKVINYSLQKDYIFIDYLADLTKIPQTLSEIVVVGDINIYSLHALDTLSKVDLILISLKKINQKTRSILGKKPTLIYWEDLFFDIVSDKAVIKRSDLDNNLQNMNNIDEILAEYKKQRIEELSK